MSRESLKFMIFGKNEIVSILWQKSSIIKILTRGFIIT